MESVEQHLRGELLQVRDLDYNELEHSSLHGFVIQTHFRIAAHMTKYNVVIYQASK